MKSSKINLIVNREDYQKYQNYFYYLKILIIVLGVLFLTTFLVYFIDLQKRNGVNDKLDKQKAFYLEILQEKKGDEAKIFYLQKKYSDLTLFLKDDSNSAPYYNLLTYTLKESSQSSQIKSFSIDKDHAFTFTIVFQNFDELLNFFKFIESDSFIKNFENISLKSFTLISETNAKENYQLSFEGKFIAIKP